MVLIRCWFLFHCKSPLSSADVWSGTLAGHKKLHILASHTSICDNSVEPRRFSFSQSYYDHITYGNEEIWLGLAEIDPYDLTDSVRSIDNRPHILMAPAKLDYSFPGHQESRVGRERIDDDDDLGSFPLLGQSYVLGGGLNLLEFCFKGPENFAKCIRRTNFNRL